MELIAASTRAVFCFWLKAQIEVSDSSILTLSMFSNIERLIAPGMIVVSKDGSIAGGGLGESMKEASIAFGESNC